MFDYFIMKIDTALPLLPRFFLLFMGFLSIGVAPICQAGTVSGDYAVSTAQSNETPSASDYDLAQTHYGSSSGTGSGEVASQHAELFNGLVGNDDDDPDDPGEVAMTPDNAVTIDFDLSEHADGYDIRAIDTYFGWKTASGGRSNQGYSIEFTFVDNSTATIPAQHWEPNSSPSYWTLVSFKAGASGPIASGVKSITFDITEGAAIVGGNVVAREFDIFGSPTGLEYSLTLQPPNGYRIPKIMGASGDQNLVTGYDYFNWYGITEHRTWFKPYFSTLADDSGITTAGDFTTASEAIRLDPTRQATASDYYIDWAHFFNEYEGDRMPEIMQHLEDRDIMPMIVNSTVLRDAPLDDWVSKFQFWKYWYTMVYYFASEHDVTMYQMRNEPHHGSADYDGWEDHWLVSADAMRKAMDDVNRDFGKSLEINLCGPVCAGAYWDYSEPDPYVDPHGWGSVSWAKVKYDIYGNYDVNNPWNYGSYDYHRYGQNTVSTEAIMRDLRTSIANANNDPSSDIPIVISEYNTSTGGNSDSRGIDTEDLLFGMSMAPLLEASGAYGPDGLGEDGGIFIFKLGGIQSGSPLVGVGNKLSYMSQNLPRNYGGVTRGGACFQMYARHFSGGKPLLPITVNSGGGDARRTLSVIDDEKGMIYIYGSNIGGAEFPVSIDLSAQDVEIGAVASLQLVDEKNTGQVTELLTVDGTDKLSFYCPNYTAFLIKVPLAGTAPYQWELSPSEDTTQQVTDMGNLGASATMNISMHHSDAAQRNVGLLRFHVEGAGNLGQALLKLSGKNIGTDQSEREIVHVYAVKGNEWDEDTTLDWSNAPGLGQYHVDDITMASTNGTGDMVDIEDNHAGFTSGVGTGLGLTGEFLGAVSFHSSDYVDNYLDVTDYLNSVDHDGSGPLDVTFVVARIVRYNVNEYSNDYYNLGDYHYDGRVVEIATKEHADADLQPRLICTTGLPPVVYADDFVASSGVSILPSSDVGGGSMIEFTEAGDSVSYDVSVSQAGTYLVGFRVASDAGSVNLELAQDGTPITTLNRFVGAGETWTTVYKMVTLQAGSTTLTVSATGGGIQFFNWFELSASNGHFEDSVVAPVNIALNQPASSNSVHSSGFLAGRAVDGNFSTRWASDGNSTPWLEVDFGSTVRVNGARFAEYFDRIRSYEIQVYNDGWETAFTGGNPSADQLDWFPVVEGSKFRLNILSATIDPTIWEFELYRAPDFSITSMEGDTDSISLEWPNTAGTTYSVLHSTDLGVDSWTPIESGIPALFETNSFTTEFPDDPAGFYRIMAE